MRKNLIPTALILMTAVGLAACAPGGGPAPSASSTGTASASSPGGTPSADAETTVPAPSPSAEFPSAGPGQGNAELAIMVTPAQGAKAVNYTLVCRNGAPAAESKHPKAAAACTALKQNAALLSPGPRPTDQACTQQYGGPQQATVTGSVDGKAVESKFSRTDGCKIAAWNAAKDVLGSSGGA
jgi:hypothetical protein